MTVKVEVIRAFQDHRVGDVITIQPNQMQPLAAMNLVRPYDDSADKAAAAAAAKAKK